MKSIEEVKAASSTLDRQEEELNQVLDKFPAKAADYFVTQCWANEIHIRNYLNFGGSHGAMKTALTSSSGMLHTATNKINRRAIERSQNLNVVGSNQNVHVRLEIRNQVVTSMLCTVISRSALEMVYAEVVKKLQHHEEEGTEGRCNCTIRTRFLLPCSHQIVLGQPIDVTAIHPRWIVQPIPVIDMPSQDIDSAMLSVLRDPPACPKGSQRLQTSAEKIQKAADRIENVRRCKSCSKVGHNRRTCPKLKMDDTQEIERGSKFLKEKHQNRSYSGILCIIAHKPIAMEPKTAGLPQYEFRAHYWQAGDVLPRERLVHNERHVWDTRDAYDLTHNHPGKGNPCQVH
ncbi:hypothetical protein V1520DRAFT_369158 [Lipomyces starkeyi]